jgi:signal transduction histidine kinase
MPGQAGPQYPAAVSGSPVTSPSLEELRTARAQQQLVVRWMRPVGWLVIILFAVYAFHSRPSPGFTGQDLGVSFALAGFLVGGIGSVATRFRPVAVQIPFLGLLVIGSAALVWLQPGGPGTVGLFMAALLIVRLLPGRARLPLSIAAFAAFALVSALTSRQQASASLLGIVALGAFYLMSYLASRLSKASEQAEQFLIELEQTRAAEARAAGLAERQRLARDMHDVLAHSLSGLLFQLEAARMLAAEDTSDPRLAAALDRAHHLGRNGLDEARQAIGMLRDDDLPGPERLAELAARFTEDRGVPCRFTVSGPRRELVSEARLAVYRVAQEALTNITKHAQPERVDMHLAYEPAAARLSVEDFAPPGESPAAGPGDDGRGGQPGPGGYGLTGMRERAELLGGTLTTEATVTGYRVELEVPA